MAGAFPSAGIDQVGHLLEGKEADAQGQRQIQIIKITAGQRVDVLQKKIKIFKIAQQCNIRNDANDNDHPSASRQTLQQPAGQIVYQDAGEDHEYICNFVVAIEDQRGNHQRNLCSPVLFQPVQAEIYQQDSRQEAQYKDIGIKKHKNQPFCFRIFAGTPPTTQ